MITRRESASLSLYQETSDALPLEHVEQLDFANIPKALLNKWTVHQKCGWPLAVNSAGAHLEDQQPIVTFIKLYLPESHIEDEYQRKKGAQNVIGKEAAIT